MLERTPLPELERTLAAHGLPLDRLCGDAQAVALFGSRAVGCTRASSDWDLLCIGAEPSRKLGALDLVWVDAGMLEAPAWLGGDLAGHVERYAIWLHGACPWKRSDLRFELATQRKEARVARKLPSLVGVWAMLSEPYRRKHATLLRREVQRLEWLERGAAVPPTALLDQSWVRDVNEGSQLSERLVSLGAAPWLAEAVTSYAFR